MKKSYVEKIIVIVLTLIHFAVSFLFEDMIFKVNLKSVIQTEGDNIKKYIIYKLVALILYFCIYKFLIRTIIKIIKKDEDTLEIVKHFCIYLTINIVLLVLTWPGIWRWDEFFILHNVTSFNFYYWQNYLTSIFYILSYFLVPIPSGVIIIQIITLSMIVAYIIGNFNKVFKETKFIYLLYIPFILLPVLDHNIYPIRLTLYSYVELLLICKLIFIKKLRADKWSFIGLSVILIILSALRTEGKVFILLIPIVFIFVLKDEINSVVKRLVYTVITVIVSIGLIIPQDYYYQNKELSRYDVTSYVNQLYVAAKCEMENNPNSEELKEIDKIINLRELLNAESGIKAHNSEKIYRDNIDDEKYSELEKISINLMMKYPKEVFAERIRTFIITSALVKNKNVHVENTRKIFTGTSNAKVRCFVENYRKFYNTY